MDNNSSYLPGLLKGVGVFNSQQVLGTLLGNDEELKMCWEWLFPQLYSGAVLCSTHLITFDS